MRVVLVNLVLPCLLAATSSFLGATTASGNGAEVISSGAALVPANSTAIRLVEEWVHVDMPTPGRAGKVTCKYTLRNITSSDTTIAMAFVTGAGRDGLRNAGIARDSGFRVRDILYSWAEIPSEYRAVDAIEWSTHVDHILDSVPVWEVTIRAGQSKLLEITYHVWCDYRYYGGRDWQSFRYHARPAALWAEDIQMAKFSFSFGSLGGSLLECLLTSTDCTAAKITPAGYTWGPQGIEWTFRDWEPDCDFEVSLLLPERGK